MFSSHAEERIIPHLKSSPFEKGRGKMTRDKQLEKSWAIFKHLTVPVSCAERISAD